jgi:multisubunit Na+/H+ antiporter MnhB subunit
MSSSIHIIIYVTLAAAALTFGVLFIISVYRHRLTPSLTFASLMVGAATTLLWALVSNHTGSNGRNWSWDVPSYVITAGAGVAIALMVIVALHAVAVDKKWRKSQDLKESTMAPVEHSTLDA